MPHCEKKIQLDFQNAIAQNCIAMDASLCICHSIVDSHLSACIQNSSVSYVTKWISIRFHMHWAWRRHKTENIQEEGGGKNRTLKISSIFAFDVYAVYVVCKQRRKKKGLMNKCVSIFFCQQYKITIKQHKQENRSSFLHFRFSHCSRLQLIFFFLLISPDVIL